MSDTFELSEHAHRFLHEFCELPFVARLIRHSKKFLIYGGILRELALLDRNFKGTYEDYFPRILNYLQEGDIDVKYLEDDYHLKRLLAKSYGIRSTMVLLDYDTRKEISNLEDGTIPRVFEVELTAPDFTRSNRPLKIDISEYSEEEFNRDFDVNSLVYDHSTGKVTSSSDLEGLHEHFEKKEAQIILDFPLSSTNSLYRLNKLLKKGWNLCPESNEKFEVAYREVLEKTETYWSTIHKYVQYGYVHLYAYKYFRSLVNDKLMIGLIFGCKDAVLDSDLALEIVTECLKERSVEDFFNRSSYYAILLRKKYLSLIRLFRKISKHKLEDMDLHYLLDCPLESFRFYVETVVVKERGWFTFNNFLNFLQGLDRTIGGGSSINLEVLEYLLDLYQELYKEERRISDVSGRIVTKDLDVFFHLAVSKRPYHNKDIIEKCRLLYKYGFNFHHLCKFDEPLDDWINISHSSSQMDAFTIHSELAKEVSEFMEEPYRQFFLNSLLRRAFYCENIGTVVGLILIGARLSLDDFEELARFNQDEMLVKYITIAGDQKLRERIKNAQGLRNQQLLLEAFN